MLYYLLTEDDDNKSQCSLNDDVLHLAFCKSGCEDNKFDSSWEVAEVNELVAIE